MSDQNDLSRDAKAIATVFAIGAIAAIFGILLNKLGLNHQIARGAMLIFLVPAIFIAIKKIYKN